MMTEKKLAAIKRAKQLFSSYSKLAEAKKEHRKRRVRAYQIENKEQYALRQRNYYRKKVGIPLDAPVMTPAECAANARRVGLQKRRAKP